MREIKFRGKSLSNGEWVYGFYTQGGYYDPNSSEMKVRHLIHCDIVVDVDPDTIGQFTGLHDKNGKEIYEGDIVDNSWCFADKGVVCFGEYQHLNAQIGYKNGDVGFYIKHLGEKASITRPDILFFAANCEVIGNIYDNPNLLEEESV